MGRHWLGLVVLGAIFFFRAVLGQLTPEAAKRIAHENAQRLFRLAEAK